jgi:DNA-binding NarL/FixJ family response regulator
VRVIIAEDVGLYREMLRQTLVGNGLEVVGEAGCADEVVALVDAGPPDIVLLDIRMPPTFTDDGLRAALRIRERHQDVAVLLLSNYGEVAYAVRLVQELGDKVGYLHKERTASARELLDAIGRVVAGGVIIDPEVVARLIRRPRVDSLLEQLTARELEALALMAEGHSNATLARQMRITVSTVEKHVTAVFRKLALSPAGDIPVSSDNARVRAVLTYLRHTGRIQASPAGPGTAPGSPGAAPGPRLPDSRAGQVRAAGRRSPT